MNSPLDAIRVSVQNISVGEKEPATCGSVKPVSMLKALKGAGSARSIALLVRTPPGRSL